jgi:hypothetical protein
MSIKAICSNSSNKPREIPKENWIVSGNEYTIHHIYKQMNPSQIGLQGCLLLEVSLEDLYKEGKTKHNCYRLDRFMFKKDDIQKLFDLTKECTQLDDINIKKELDSLTII